MADLPRIHGVGGPVRVSVTGKSKLMLSVIGVRSRFAPESPEARFWAVLRETVPCSLFGFGRTVPGRVFGPCERVGATRQD